MVKDGIREEIMEEMTLTITPDSNEDCEDEDLIDGDDRQFIDRVLEQLTETDPQNKPKTRLNRDHPMVASQPSACRTTSSLNRTVQIQPGSHSRQRSTHGLAMMNCSLS